LCHTRCNHWFRHFRLWQPPTNWQAMPRSRCSRPALLWRPHPHGGCHAAYARKGWSPTAWIPVFWCSTSAPTRSSLRCWPSWVCHRQVGHVVFGAGPRRSARAALEWSGTSLDTVFAQRSNLVNPRFWGMLRDLLRFNALTTRMAQSGTDAQCASRWATFCGAGLQARRFAIGTFCP
jgi:hypothetical protein